MAFPTFFSRVQGALLHARSYGRRAVSVNYCQPRFHRDHKAFPPSQREGNRCYTSASPCLLSPNFTSTRENPRKKKFVPRKAAVELTNEARTFFHKLLASNPDKAGIMLNYQQATSGQPRMVFSFSFVTSDDLSPEDEGVSLELMEDGIPKPPRDSINDGLPKLFVHHNAFLKVLGATVDVDTHSMSPILYDREGNRMDPNF